MEEINAVAKLIDSQPAASLTTFISEVVGKPMIDRAGILYIDALKERREYNSLKLKLKYHEKKADLLKTAPLDFTYQLLDKASLVEDESLQDYWANLLAYATDAKIDETPRKIFVDILSKLEPQDVRVFERIKTVFLYDYLINSGDIGTGVFSNEEHTSVEVLVSLGLLNYRMKIPSKIKSAGALQSSVILDYSTVNYTTLGDEFYKAVSR